MTITIISAHSDENSDHEKHSFLTVEEPFSFFKVENHRSDYEIDHNIDGLRGHG